MTGAIGFIIGALCIAIFALTARRAYPLVPERKLQLFSTAFSLLAAAMLVWAATVISNNTQITKELMLASDGLLILATGCMIQLLMRRTHLWFTAVLSALGAVTLGLRAYAFTPTAFVHDGLLYFNLATDVRMVIVGAFVVFWLPAVMTVASYSSEDKSLRGAENLLSLAFTVLIAVTALFLSAKRSVMIISLFALMALLFLLMAAVNLLIIKLHQTSSGGKHATPAAR